MQNLTTDQKLGKEILRQSRECERGIIAVSAWERVGYSYIAPNLLLWSWIPVEDPNCKVFDMALN